MSNRIKPWQQRKPHNQDKRKRIVPLRTSGDQRLVPLRPSDNRVIPMEVGDRYGDMWIDEDEETFRS